jgi:hypothetical protein
MGSSNLAGHMSTEWEGAEVKKPLLVTGDHRASSIWVVVVSTAIAVCGSFVFGISVYIFYQAH